MKERNRIFPMGTTASPGCFCFRGYSVFALASVKVTLLPKKAVSPFVIASISRYEHISDAECIASCAIPMSHARTLSDCAAISPMVEPHGKSEFE